MLFDAFAYVYQLFGNPHHFQIGSEHILFLIMETFIPLITQFNEAI